MRNDLLAERAKNCIAGRPRRRISTKCTSPPPCPPQAPIKKYVHIRCQATGILALHDMDILHRDIKPDNILVDAALCVRLSGFGTAIVMLQSPLPCMRYSRDYRWNGRVRRTRGCRRACLEGKLKGIMSDYEVGHSVEADW